ncbi:MAG: beta-hydroxyacyl-ACP dehydratase [Actinomycetota bacterium]|nr:beta-hydroxyacyl-ACP dehydratase [Actinomycetota bacterium]
MRYYMIDRVTALTPGESAEGVKSISLSEDILQDHFPDYPVFPGALIIEAMAQLGGFLLEMSLNTPTVVRRALLAQVDQVKFHRIAEPGDQLLIRAELGPTIEDAAKVHGHVQCGSERVAQGTLTFIMKELDLEAIHQQRRMCYRIWTRHLALQTPIL